MLRCIVVVYGELYEIFDQYILPLHIESIAQLSKEQQQNIRFEIYTKDDSLGFYSDNLDNLSKIVNLQFAELNMPRHLRLVESNWLHGQLIDGNNSGEYLCFMCPDWIIPGNFYGKILEWIDKGYENALCYCPRTSKDEMLSDITGENHLDRSQLLDLGIKNLHPSQENLFIDSSNFAYWASSIWFSDLSVCCFHPHPLFMKAKNYKWPGGSVDGYLTGLFDINKTKYIQPSELPIFEISDSSKTTMGTGQPFNEVVFRDFIKRNITARQRYWFHNILHFNPYVSVSCQEVHTILQLVDSITDLHIGPTCQIQ